MRKLADGNCWMAQNLDLNLSTSVALTSATTDLNSKSSWTPQENTRTAYAANWNSTNASRSYDFGNVYYANGYSTTIGEAPYYNSPTQTSGQPYWHLGNSYNWYAAYAGTTAVDRTADVPDSICPKGWKLPKAFGEKSFDNLLYTVYEFGSDATANIQRITASPFNYVIAGSIDAGSYSGYPYYMGVSSSGYKTSEPNNGQPYLLAFTKTSLLGRDDVFYISYSGLSVSINSAYGGPIRCVAR